MPDTVPSWPAEKADCHLLIEDTDLELGRWTGIEGTINMGADGLGEVVAVGDDVKFIKVGDYVTCVFCGSFSEFTTPKAKNCFKVPSLDPAYAALRVAGTYSCCLLEALLAVKSGQSILITAACGGVGHVAVQIAKLNSCHVIGTCGGPIKKEKVLEMGADRVVDYTTEVCPLINGLIMLQSVEEVLKTEYPDGLDYVLESVGGEMMRVAFNSLAAEGKMVVIG